ncbi:MAG: hypothetical protein R3F60_16205 [bacterium]
MRTVLVTGFGPFPGVPHNVSGSIARAVDGACLGGLRCRGAVLDTSWARAWPQLRAAVGEARPLGLILLGVAPRARVEVELIARNRRLPRPDCDGALPDGPLVAPAGPDELPTTLPLDPATPPPRTLAATCATRSSTRPPTPCPRCRTGLRCTCPATPSGRGCGSSGGWWGGWRRRWLTRWADATSGARGP